MGCLGVQVLEVPEIIVSGLCLGYFVMGFGFGSVDKIREFEGILNEEHGDVVSDDIPVS